MNHQMYKLKRFIGYQINCIEDLLKILYLFVSLFFVISFIYTPRIYKAVLIHKLEEAKNKICGRGRLPNIN